MTRTPRALSLLACTALALSGCATQLDRQTIIKAQGDGGTTVGNQSGGTGQTQGSTTTGSSGIAAPTTTGGALTPVQRSGPAVGGTAPGLAPGTDGGTGPTVSGPSSSTTGAGTSTAKANGEPILIGVIGSVSGLYGPVFTPMLDGIQIHIATINSRGGINGHPVKLFVSDDNADPANYSSLVRSMVEKDHVIGFINLHGITLSQAVIGYIESKGIPVIDGDDSNQLSPTSRMIFNFGGAGTNLNASEVGAVRQITGPGKKVGFISCQEVQQCTNYADSFPGFAGRAGFSSVYAGRATLTAPDFTQNCLQARNSGAEVLFLRMDTNSVKRIARDCSRQGYTPKYALSPALTDNTFPSNPALEGMIIPSQTFPFISAKTPEEKDFQAAMRRNRSADKISAGNGQGWAVASIFQKAASSIAPDATPATALLLKGLYTFKGERLNGQTQPLTYRPGKPPVNAGNPCSFPMLLTKGAWTTPTGGALTCLAP